MSPLAIRIAEPSDVPQVEQLWASNRQQLGFLPLSAFEEAATHKRILVATRADQVVGYVLFFLNRKNNEIRIVHLCVNKDSRGSGVGRLLVDELVAQHPNAMRVRLNCREDFAVAQVWPRLGFYAFRRIPGRSKAGSTLIDFRREINRLPLFTKLDDSDTRMVVVLDANVFIDVFDSARPHHEESTGLQADWLSGELDLRLTREIYNDAQRQPEPLQSRMRNEAGTNWDCVEADDGKLQAARNTVREVMGLPSNEGDRSDQEHISHAVAYGADAFCTRDEPILGHAEEIFERTGLTVGRPSELVVRYDSLLESHQFQQRELSGSGLTKRQISSIDEVDWDTFFRPDLGDKRKSLIAKLVAAIANPQTSQVFVIETKVGGPLALVALRHGARVSRVFLFRTSRQYESTRLGRSIIEHLADNPLGDNPIKPEVCRIADPVAVERFEESFSRRGFIKEGDDLVKVNLHGVVTCGNIGERLQSLSESGLLAESTIATLVETFPASKLLQECRVALNAQHLLHPLKLRDSTIPSFVVPIEPEWAKELFDYRLWDMPIIQPDSRLVLNPDSIYYKSSQPRPNSDVGHILWYVSGEVGAIRACSMMTKRVTDTVKNLFRRFRSYGVYDWKQLMARFGDAEKEAMVICFQDTELLSPIAYSRVNDILESHAMKRQNFQSATSVPLSAFLQLYDEGSR